MKRKIRKAAVIGSGIMGSGITALLAGAGIRVLLLDIVPFDLKENEKKDPKARNRIVKAGIDAALKASPAAFMHKKDLSLITTGNLEDDIEKLADCDWIIEVVVENLKIKKELLKRVAGVRKKGSIISTNTSGIPLKSISKGLNREFKQHFMGTHFFNPVRYMHLLELTPGEETLPEALAFIADFGERVLGKGIVWAKDTPNFVANRIGVQGMGKTMQAMLEDDLTIPEVDTLLGPVMGRPKTAIFKTCDLVGLDTMAHVMSNNYDLVPKDEQRNTFIVPDFVKSMIEKKLLGDKTGAGFYKKERTPAGKTVRYVINPETLEYGEYEWPTFPSLEQANEEKTLPLKIRTVVGGKDKGAAYVWKVISNGLIYAANRIPEISKTIVEVDNAMKWGYNFEMGPFETWDAIGLKQSVKRMEKEGMKVPAKIKKMLKLGNTAFYKHIKQKKYYYDFSKNEYKEIVVSDSVISLDVLKQAKKVVKSCASASLIDLGDDVFCCEFHTKMNALNGEIIEFMGKALDYVDANGAGLVIGNQAGGMPGAFSAGADLKMMVDLANKKQYSVLGDASKALQDIVQKEKYASFPVVAAPYGMTLGGGCEVCLGADKIVSHIDLFMGLVEIGVGLLPAGGGCLNLWKKLLNSIPEPVEGVDLGKYFIPAFMAIAMAKVSTSAKEAASIGFIGPKDRIVFNRDYLIGEAKKEVLKMADEGYVAPVKKTIKVMGQAGQGMVNSELFNMKSAGYVSDHDVFLAKRIAYVVSGGEVRTESEIDEDVVLQLEREAFMDFWKEEKTIARVNHMLKTGRPLRN